MSMYKGNKMAKIVEDIVVLRLSRLVKNDELDVAQVVNEALRQEIEEAVQSLVSEAVVVEAERN